MSTQESIIAQWESIVAQIGYEGLSYNLENQPEVAAKLGRAVFGYMAAMVYDTDFEGWTEEDLKGIEAFLKDLRRGMQAGLVG